MRTRFLSWIFIWMSAFWFLLGVSPEAFAQTNRGGISGNVTDTSGAVVPNARITITNMGTNGAYIQENLEPAEYKVEVTAPGFKKAEVLHVKVDTGTVATANVMLEPGNVSTQVTVSASTSMVNTESATVGQT